MEKLEKAASKNKDIVPHVLRLKKEGATVRLRNASANDALNQTCAVSIKSGDKYIIIHISQKLYHTLKECLYEGR